MTCIPPSRAVVSAFMQCTIKAFAQAAASDVVSSFFSSSFFSNWQGTWGHSVLMGGPLHRQHFSLIFLPHSLAHMTSLSLSTSLSHQLIRENYLIFRTAFKNRFANELLQVDVLLLIRTMHGSERGTLNKFIPERKSNTHPDTHL